MFTHLMKYFKEIVVVLFWLFSSGTGWTWTSELRFELVGGELRSVSIIVDVSLYCKTLALIENLVSVLILDKLNRSHKPDCVSRAVEWQEEEEFLPSSSLHRKHGLLFCVALTIFLLLLPQSHLLVASSRRHRASL